MTEPEFFRRDANPDGATSVYSTNFSENLKKIHHKYMYERCAPNIQLAQLLSHYNIYKYLSVTQFHPVHKWVVKRKYHFQWKLGSKTVRIHPVRAKIFQSYWLCYRYVYHTNYWQKLCQILGECPPQVGAPFGKSWIRHCISWKAKHFSSYLITNLIK